MIPNNTIRLLLASVATLVVFQSSSVLPPAYLQELNIDIKEITEQESTYAFSTIKNKAIIAIRSLKNGGYIYTSAEGNNQTIKTLRSEETAKFLAYASTTPQETQFIVLKNKNNKNIVLKSIYMEGKVLACNSKTDTITFKKYDPTDASQKWILKSGDDLNQIYLQNKETGGFLSVETEEQTVQVPLAPNKGKSESCMNCASPEKPTKTELFKIIVLD